MYKLNEISTALKSYSSAIKILKKYEILINKQSFTCQIGEWLVATLFEGERARSGTQKDWDVNVKGKLIQVKTHAKASGNSNKFSVINKNIDAMVDQVIIIVFTEDYKLKHFYQIPYDKAYLHIQNKGKRDELHWSTITNYEIPLSELPKQEIIKLFL